MYDFVVTNLFKILVVGEWVACSVGANFTPHILTVNSGEVNVNHETCLVVDLCQNLPSDFHNLLGSSSHSFQSSQYLDKQNIIIFGLIVLTFKCFMEIMSIKT